MFTWFLGDVLVSVVFDVLIVMLVVMATTMVWDNLVSQDRKRKIRKTIKRGKYLWKTRKSPKVVLWSNAWCTGLVPKHVYNRVKEEYLKNELCGFRSVNREEWGSVSNFAEMRIPGLVLFMNGCSSFPGLPSETFWLMDQTSGTLQDLERILEGCQVHRQPFYVPHRLLGELDPGPQQPPMPLENVWQLVWGDRRKFDGQFDNCFGYKKVAA